MKITKTQRQIIEAAFYDQVSKETDYSKINVFDSFSLAAQENLAAEKIFGNLKGKTMLDLGCGVGDTAIYWALKGASVEGADISQGMVKIATKLAKKYKTNKNCRFHKMTAEKLLFKDNAFDYIFGAAILHHVDLDKTLGEIKRVLKIDGKAIFVEPIIYNPVIEIYRKMAGKLRTPTEKPLKLADFKKIKTYFPHMIHNEYHLLSLMIFLWFFLVSRVDPGKERYWKKILTVQGFEKNMLRILIYLDKIVLRLFPPLRLISWSTLVVLQK